MTHPQSKAEVFAAIRRDSRAGLSGRQIAIKYRVSRNTVAEALRQPWPEPRKKMAPRASRLDEFKPLIDEMLRADLDAPRKQRHTAKRIFARLVDEHQAMEISYQIVRAYVAHRRGEIRVEAGRGPPEAFVPQSHLPGVEAEVDFGDVTVRISGEQVKCFLFSFRLSYSGKAVHRVLATGGQEAFFEGHVHAFRVLGGYVGDFTSTILCLGSRWSLSSRSGHAVATGVGTTGRCRPRVGCVVGSCAGR